MKDRNKSSTGMHYGAPQKVFQNAKDLRKNLTNAELVLWEELKQKKLGVKFRRQHPIHLFVLDFYCHELKLSIELDGGYHENKAQKELDLQRTQALEKIGITELRFENELIFNDITQVLIKIKSKLDELKK